MELHTTGIDLGKTVVLAYTAAALHRQRTRRVD
jgi:hypothetical protein